MHSHCPSLNVSGLGRQEIQGPHFIVSPHPWPRLSTAGITLRPEMAIQQLFAWNWITYVIIKYHGYAESVWRPILQHNQVIHFHFHTEPSHILAQEPNEYDMYLLKKRYICSVCAVQSLTIISPVPNSTKNLLCLWAGGAIVSSWHNEAFYAQAVPHCMSPDVQGSNTC